MKNLFCGFLAAGIVLTAIVAIATADDAKDEAIKKDRKQVEGTWQIVGLVVNGDKKREEDVKKLTVVNGSDGSWSLIADGKKVNNGTSTIDPTKKPKTIDFTPIEGGDGGKQFLGIYELGENTRKLCFGLSGSQRPTDFSSAPGSQQILVMFERVKAK